MSSENVEFSVDEIRNLLRKEFGKGNFKVFKDGRVRVYLRDGNFARWIHYGNLNCCGLIVR